LRRPPTHPPRRAGSSARSARANSTPAPSASNAAAPLRCFYTDAWCGTFRGLFAKLPGPFKALTRRYHPELPPGKVVGFTLGSILHGSSKRPSENTDALYHHYEAVGKWFATRVASRMKSLPLDPARDCLLAFSTGGARDAGIRQVAKDILRVDQLDPAQVDEEMIREESERWPGWDAIPGKVPQSYYDRLAKEWALADLVIVNSEFSKRAIHKHGVPLEKLAVVPLAYETEGATGTQAEQQPDKPLHVLWLGQSCCAKASPICLKPPDYWRRPAFIFRWPPTWEFQKPPSNPCRPTSTCWARSPATRPSASSAKADVFVLPTISDGFALTQLEAMSFGLPVITTPNCGDVVAHGEDGYIIPIRDPAALAAAIQN